MNLNEIKDVANRLNNVVSMEIECLDCPAHWHCHKYTNLYGGDCLFSEAAEILNMVYEAATSVKEILNRNEVEQ